MPDIDVTKGVGFVSIASNTIVFATSALTLVVALAWNTAFKAYFDSKPELRVYGPWVYAVTVTVIALVGITVFNQTKNLIDARISTAAAA